MAKTTPLAYNIGSLISGTTQIGDLAVGVTGQDYSSHPGNITWWMSPDEELGYVIGASVSGNTQPTEIPGVNASVGFYVSTSLTDNSFIDLANYIGSQNGQLPFTTASQSQNWLNNNGYWSSYPITTETYFILFQDNTIMTAQNGNQIEKQY